MRIIRLVAARELMEYFRSKAYWVTMGLLVLGVVAAVVLPRVLDTESTYDLGVAGEAPAGLEEAVDGLAEAFEVQLEVVQLDSRIEAEAAVDDEEVDAALVFDATDAELLRRAGTSETVVAIAGQATVSVASRDQLLDAGIDPEIAEGALTTPPPAETTIDDEQTGRSAVAWALSLLLYLAIFMGGMSVATGVSIEKSTRIAEVLVTTVRPSQLLAGKVLGVGTSTLLLLVAAAVPFTVAVLTGHVDVPTAAAVDVIGGLGWFVLGYAIYATAFAALGALVDRQEDVGSAVGPLITALILSYLAAFQAQAQPNSLLAQVISIFPLSAPIVMPVRIAENAATPAEIAAAIGIGIVTLLLLVRIGGTIYQRALLRGGRRLKVREVLRG